MAQAAMVQKKNWLFEAGGALKEARRCVIQQVQEMKIQSANAETAWELLGLARRLEILRCEVEAKAHSNGG